MQGFIIAICRVTIGIAFTLFGIEKLFSSDGFGGKSFFESFPNFVQAALTAGHPYGFWRPFLEKVVVPHTSLFAWSVALGELLLGVSLVLGYFTRWSSLAGILLMASIHFCSNPFAVPAPLANQIGGLLEHLSLIIIFLMFAAVGAGKSFGLDGLKKRAKSSSKDDSQKEK